MRSPTYIATAALLLVTGAQGQAISAGARGPQSDPSGAARGMAGAQRGLPPGRWWENREVSEMLALTPEQRSSIDGILQQNRQRLFELSQAIQREDFAMQGLMDADKPDEVKILTQVDRVASARAELEKANARMLLAMRRVLTAEQWKKLQAFNHMHPPHVLSGPPPPPG